jgi:hypothetical protein
MAYPHIGDHVRFLDSVGGGIVKRIDTQKKLVYVEDEDGFEIPALPTQCVIIKSDFPADAEIVSNKDEEPEREVEKTDKTAKRPDIIEVDLHINQLVDDTRGMTHWDMMKRQLALFDMTVRQNMANKGQKIVFIHGRGEGVLKAEIEKMLRHDFPTCSYQDASFREYGFGATMVVIH